MIDIKKIEAEARKEVADAATALAKDKIKNKLKQIAGARAVLVNLEHEYEVLLRQIGSEMLE